MSSTFTLLLSQVIVIQFYASYTIVRIMTMILLIFDSRYCYDHSSIVKIVEMKTAVLKPTMSPGLAPLFKALL